MIHLCKKSYILLYSDSYKIQFEFINVRLNTRKIQVLNWYENIIYLCISFTSNNKILVGHEAVSQAEHNPQNTIYDAKRFIGKPFTKPELETEQQRYPFKVHVGS